MWIIYLISTLGIIFFIGMVSYCFIFIVNSHKEEMNKYKQLSSFDQKLLEHCRVRSNPNEVEEDKNDCENGKISTINFTCDIDPTDEDYLLELSKLSIKK